jgi:aspartate racemase
VAHATVPLKTIGLIGGSSAQATREYYRLFDEFVREALGGDNAAELLLYSMNFENIVAWLRDEDWDAIAAYVADKARRLECGGADFVLLVSNTLHRVSDRVASAIDIPFVDIFDATSEAIRAAGLTRVGLLGTFPVMTDPYYADRYLRHGVEVVVPGEADRREVDRIIFEELCRGVFLPESKATYRRVADDLLKAGAEGIILGCTEITLLIGAHDLGGIPTFDTARLHCQKAVSLCLPRP